MNFRSTLSTYSNLRKFIESGTISDTLGKIHDVHFDAAKSTLHRLYSAEEPRSIILTAISNLQAASEAAKSIYWNRDHNSYYIDVEAMTIVHMRHMWAMAHLFMCYSYLGEKSLARRTLDDMWEAHNLHHRKLEFPCVSGQKEAAGIGMVRLLNPRNWASPFIYGNEPSFDCEQMDIFSEYGNELLDTL